MVRGFVWCCQVGNFSPELSALITGVSARVLAGLNLAVIQYNWVHRNSDYCSQIRFEQDKGASIKTISARLYGHQVVDAKFARWPLTAPPLGSGPLYIGIFS